MAFLAMMHSKLVIFAFVIGVVLTCNITIATPSPFVLKLVRASKLLAPNYDPNETHLDRVKREIIESSMARYAYLKKKSMKDDSNGPGDVIQPELRAGIPLFFVNFSVGTPVMPQMVAMDSGSNLLWIQCLPCDHCTPTAYSSYYPSKSSTFSMVNKSSPDCKVPQDDTSSHCTFDMHYDDGSSTRGELIKETITFETADEGIVAKPNLIFGCARQNSGTNVRNGILGLGADPISLVSQLGSKFSYCIGNISDAFDDYNKLVLGEGAFLLDHPIPMEIKNGLYYVTLESIKFGDQKLDVDPSVFKLSPEGHGGVVIDTGSFITYLARSAYNALIQQIENWSYRRLSKVTLQGWSLCYESEGTLKQDLYDFPTVEFSFSGNIFAIRWDRLFYQFTREAFCLTVIPVDDHELNIIGVFFQQYTNVGYDIANKAIYLTETDCRFLQD